MQRPAVDARAYDAWAQEIAAGHWWGNDVFFLAPLYPYFVGVVYAIFGRSLLTLHVVQMLIGATACVLAYLAGRRLFREEAGLISGWLLAFYAPAIYFDGVMHKEGLALFLLMLVILLLAHALHRSSPPWFLAAGIAAGLLALTRENLLILLMIVPLWALACTGLGPLRRRARMGAMFAVALVLTLLPVSLRNYAVGSTFALTLNLGQNFYIGNNLDATGVYEPLIANRQDPLYEQQDAKRLAEQQAGREMAAGEVSSFWLRRGLQFVFDQPGDWLRLMGRKVLLAWNRFEAPDTEDLYFYAEQSRVLGSLSNVLHFGVLAPLGMAGAVLAWRYRHAALFLYLLLASITVSVAAFFVFARYRYSLAAPLVLLAGAGIAEVVHMLRRRPLAAEPSQVGSTRAPRPLSPPSTPGPVYRLLLAGLVGAGFIFLVNRPLLEETAYRSIAYVNLASIHEKAGELPQGIAAAGRALELYPESVLAHLHLGRMLDVSGADAKAEHHLLRAAALAPELTAAHVALADLYERQRRPGDEVAQLRAAIIATPGNGDLHLRLGRLLLVQGNDEAAKQEFGLAVKTSPSLAAQLSPSERALTEQAQTQAANVLARARQALQAGAYAEAVSLYEEAAMANPEDASLHYQWATALAAVEDYSAAEQQFTRAISLLPGFAAAHNDLGQLLTNAGAFDGAIEHYRAALAAEPEMIPAHYNLATTLAAAGRIEEAITAMETCLKVARGRAPATVIARIEDRLSRLREEHSRSQSKNRP